MVFIPYQREISQGPDTYLEVISSGVIMLALKSVVHAVYIFYTRELLKIAILS